jgi:protein-S-isoprenylcysteine O-methyltransferase Ste14
MKSNYKYYRVLYSAFSFLTLGAVIVYHFALESIMLWKVHVFEVIIAVTGIITGGAFMIFFAGKFFFDLSGADIFLPSKKPQALIKTSFYKYVRHPLYTATLLFVWSIFFWQPLLSNLISCVCITVYTIVGIRYEEKKLIKDFGESYIQYRAETPMLLPKFLTLKKRLI